MSKNLSQEMNKRVRTETTECPPVFVLWYEQHPVSARIWYKMFLLVDQLAGPGVDFHRRKSLMDSSLLLQQCTACLGSVSTIVWTHHIDANRMHKERAWWERHKMLWAILSKSWKQHPYSYLVTYCPFQKPSKCYLITVTIFYKNYFSLIIFYYLVW